MSHPIHQFLKDLAQNNNREWFAENKGKYEDAKNLANDYFQSVAASLSEFDEFSKYKMYRIYKDIRFSKDKTPYKTHFGAIFQRKQPQNRGSFYMHIEPNNVFLGGGFWQPNKEDLLRIRKAVEIENDLELILQDPILKSTYGEMQGDKLKTAPKGFDKHHPRINLINYQQFFFSMQVEDEVLFQDKANKIPIKAYQTLQAFFRYMTGILTTDENGESIF